MDIIFSANNNEEIKVLPVVPNDIEVTQAQNNEEFTTLNNGILNLIGDMGLKSLSISSFFINQDYSFMKKGSKSDAWSYVEFFKKWRAKRIPIRIVITSSSGKEILNMPCTVDSFSYSEASNGNINYSLDIKEYKFVSLVVS